MSAMRVGARILALVTVASLVAAVRLNALPRYAARYEQGCALCHLNPTGGGMRTPYAARALVPHEFAVAHRAGPPAFQLGPEISFGLDERELYTAASPASDGLDFFLMQTDVYAAFQPDSQIVLYVDRGNSGTLETFGMDYCLPWNGYLKAGRFTAPYGWKFDDHTHFVREDLGFTPPSMSDVGLEAGFSPPGGNLQAAVLNGNRGSVIGADRRLAESVTAIDRFRVGPVAAALGGSGYHEKNQTAEVTMGGLHSYLTFASLVWIGEVDLVDRKPLAGGTEKQLATTHELSFMPAQGVELIGSYDFLDPDLDEDSGAKDRWGGTVQLFLHPSLVLSGSYTATHYALGSQMSGTDTRSLILQAHFLY